MKQFDRIGTIKALGEESRLRILRGLLNGSHSVNDLATSLGLSTYNTSKHLRILKDAGLVECEKHGQQRLYAIAADLRLHLAANSQVLDLGCCLFRFDQLLD